MRHSHAERGNDHIARSVDADKASGLVRPQPRIQTTMGEQFGVGTALGDLAVFQHHQTVHARDGRETVGDDDSGAASLDLGKYKV